MPAFIFLCDFSTEQECLDRKLFGTNPGESHKHHYSKIAIGDTLFLYNLDTGFMRGPYAAATPCKSNIEPAAWKKSRRSFPWQVRVDPTNAFMTPLSADALRRIITLDPTSMGLLPPSEIADDKTAQIIEAFKQANPAA